LFANYHTTFTDGTNSSAFEVTRSYFGYDFSFSKEISSRVMYDGTTEVINGKTIYSGYLRMHTFSMTTEKSCFAAV
jgi:hypothetical protein